MTETFDFVIVGAGSAGCAMAYRLSEDGKNTVCVLEYGGSDRGPFIQMPSALSYPMNMSLYNWGFETEPEPALGGRRLATPRGKVVGGSSSINGMVYVRGHARDFDTWAQLGCKGWSYADVLPYFRKAEDNDTHDNRYNGNWVGKTWHAGPPSAKAYHMNGFQLGWKPWRKGDRLGYFNKRYVEVDYRSHHLRPPPTTVWRTSFV